MSKMKLFANYAPIMSRAIKKGLLPEKVFGVLRPDHYSFRLPYRGRQLRGGVTKNERISRLDEERLLKFAREL